MPDLQNEIRNEKLQDIKQERHLLRHDIWSAWFGASWAVQMRSALFWELPTFRHNLSVPKRQDKTASLRCIKNPEERRPRNLLTCTLHNCITWYRVIKLITYDSAPTNQHTMSQFPRTSPAPTNQHTMSQFPRTSPGTTPYCYTTIQPVTGGELGIF